MSTKTFNISFPTELADQIDRFAKKQFATRSDFLRAAAQKYLREEERWDKILKFSRELDADFKARGITDEYISKAMKEVRQELYAERQQAEARKLAKATRRRSR